MDVLDRVGPGDPRVITDEAVDAAMALNVGFESIVELEINPARMRGYGKTNRAEMDFNGGNFSSALWTDGGTYSTRSLVPNTSAPTGNSAACRALAISQSPRNQTYPSMS
jgi:hypothetical protein